MLLNFNAQQLAPNIVQSTTPAFDKYAALGLTPSGYGDLMQHAGTGYYYKDGTFYEPIIQSKSNLKFVTSPFGYQLGYKQAQPSSFGGIYGLASSSGGGGGNSKNITIGDQQFKPVTFGKKQTLPAGFMLGDKVDGVQQYDISQIYLNSLRPQTTYAPIPNVASFLSSPTDMTAYQGNYGAGQYLGNNGLLGLNFSAPQVVATTAGQ